MFLKKINTTFLFFFIHIILIYCCNFLLPEWAISSDVFIESGNNYGQGILRQRGAECLAITPYHVIEGGSTDLSVTFADRSKLEAQLFEHFPGDIALLRLNATFRGSCRNEKWTDGSNLDALLNIEKQGELRTMMSDGSVIRTMVDIVSYDKYKNIIVRPVNSNDQIQQGKSGSPLYISGQLAGMLLSVKIEGKDVKGIVLRQDALNATVALFFHNQNQTTASPDKQLPINKSTSNTPAVSFPQQQASPNQEAPTAQEFSGQLQKGNASEHHLNLEANSPIRLMFPLSMEDFLFIVEIIDSNSKRVFREEHLSVRRENHIPFTPHSSGIHTIRISGERGEGKYAFKVVQIALDAQLRGQANILDTGGAKFDGVLAPGAVGEFRIKLEANSPVRFSLPATGDEVNYFFEILDTNLKNLYRSDRCTAKRDNNFPFTAKTSGMHTIRMTGDRGEGKFILKATQIALDSQLRGQANVLDIGGAQVNGILATGAVAEFRAKLEANSPVKFSLPATGDEFSYFFEVLDANAKPLFRSDRCTAMRETLFPFTAKTSGVHLIRMIGDRGEGKFTLKASQIAHDAQLRGQANVLDIGGAQVDGMLATGAIAEFRVKLEANSPVRFTLPATGDEYSYFFEIFDDNAKSLLRSDRCTATRDYSYPFTAKTSGMHIIKMTGDRGDGKFILKATQITLDAQLRGQANILTIGGTHANGMLAASAVAEFRVMLEANSPVKFVLPATGASDNYAI